MSDPTRLERSYRRLLAVYPAGFRREHEEEILVLMDATDDGRQRPRLADAADLLAHAISMRLHQLLTGGDHMDAAKGLRGWWLSPPRSGMQRLIFPYEYRHLRGFAVTRVAGASVAATAGIVCLSYDAYAWAAFFLAVGALNLAASYWYLTIARSQREAARPRS